jgi:hypothetical protein
MILLGCLLAFSIALAPRAVLVLAWLFSERWPVVWQGDWIVPLLGIIFLPFTTIMYLLAWQPAVAGGAHIEGWDWMWILLGLLLDLSKWAGLWGNRSEATRQAQRYYPSGAPTYGGSGGTGGTQASVSSGQVPPSTSPTAADSSAEPMTAATPPEVPRDDRPGG